MHSSPLAPYSYQQFNSEEALKAYQEASRSSRNLRRSSLVSLYQVNTSEVWLSNVRQTNTYMSSTKNSKIEQCEPMLQFPLSVVSVIVFLNIMCPFHVFDITDFPKRPEVSTSIGQRFYGRVWYLHVSFRSLQHTVLHKRD